MSGLCAIYRPDGPPISESEMTRISEAGGHRGIDGRALLSDGVAGLAQLIQRSHPGSMEGIATARDGALRLVADIRLDNAEPLQRELAPGPPGRPATDGDLVLAAYERWGEGCVERLEGDFAFALWDRHASFLFCARDRLGIKPLHFARRDGETVVASEAQQILALPGFPARLDRLTIGRYLVNCLPDDERTPFAEIRSVEAGHTLRITRTAVERRAYWTLAKAGGERATLASDGGDRFVECLRRSVEARIEHREGPVGILVSGGVDSSSIAALAQPSLGPDLHGVAHVFDSLPACDERRYSTALTDALGMRLDHHRPEASSLFAGGTSLVDRESPMIDWSAHLREVFATLQHRGARVVLTGHGGDSVAGGSPLLYSDLLRRGRWRQLARDLRQHAQRRQVPISRLIYHYLAIPNLPGPVDNLIRRLAGRAPYRRVPGWIDPSFARQFDLSRELARFYQPHRWGRSAAVQIERTIGARGSVGRAVYFLDRLGHRFGLDLRHPFLDARLLECALALPPEELYRAGESKIPLRRGVPNLPPLIRDRQTKASFRSYFDASLRGPDAPTVRRLLAPAEALADLGFVDPKPLRSAVEAYLSGTDEVDAGVIFFTASIELWLRETV